MSDNCQVLHCANLILVFILLLFLFYSLIKPINMTDYVPPTAPPVGSYPETAGFVAQPFPVS